MNLLVKMADSTAIENLKEEFYKIDKDRTGMINAEELRKAMKESNIDIPKD